MKGIGMIKTLVSCKMTLIVITLWVMLFLLDQQIGIGDSLSGKGMHTIGRSYYRYITAAMLHVNFFHLVMNGMALFFVGRFLEKFIGSTCLTLFMVSGTFLASLIFSCIYKDAESFIGGSICIFTLIGLIITLQLFSPTFPRLKFGTLEGDWIIAYCVLGNIPAIPIIRKDTIVIHLIACLTGAGLGVIGFLLRLLLG